MKVVLSRTYNKNETISSLIAFEGEKRVYSCKTIELPWLNNQHNISCIPEGVYDCLRIIHPAKGRCFAVQNVPDRDGILIHKGNYVNGSKIDSKGCILPGISFDDINDDGFIDILDSTIALNNLLTLLTESFKLIII